MRRTTIHSRHPYEKEDWDWQALAVFDLPLPPVRRDAKGPEAVTTHRETYARAYVARAARSGLAGRELDGWVQSASLTDLTGVSRRDLRKALDWLRANPTPEFQETGVAPHVTPQNLYGKRGGE